MHLGVICKQRVTFLLSGLTDPNDPEPDEEELEMRHALEEEKTK